MSARITFTIPFADYPRFLDAMREYAAIVENPTDYDLFRILLKDFLQDRQPFPEYAPWLRRSRDGAATAA